MVRRRAGSSMSPYFRPHIEREASVVVVVEKYEVFRGRKQKAADVFAKWTRPHFAG